MNILFIEFHLTGIIFQVENYFIVFDSIAFHAAEYIVADVGVR